MSKGIYRSKKINDVDEAVLFDKVRDRPVVVGVDLAKQWTYARLVDRTSSVSVDEPVEVFETIRWENTPQLGQFVELLDELPARCVEVVVEPSSTYGDPLKQAVEDAQMPVFEVQPKKTRDSVELFDGVPSMHDAKAADIIARLHLLGASRQVTQDGDQRRLKAAGRHMDYYKQKLNQAVGHLESKLARHWPELLELLGLTSATLLELIAEFGGPGAVAARPAEARQLMRRVSRGALSDDKIERIIASARQTVGKPMVDEEIAFLADLAADGRRAQLNVRPPKARLEELSESNPSADWMATVVGQATAGLVVGELGDPRSFESASAYEKAAGLNLAEDSSGQTSQDPVIHISKRGSSRSRNYLYLAALRLIKDCPYTRAWYDERLLRNGDETTKAVVAVMRKLIKALYHIGRGNPYDPTQLYDVSRLDVTAETQTGDNRPDVRVAVG